MISRFVFHVCVRNEELSLWVRSWDGMHVVCISLGTKSTTANNSSLHRTLSLFSSSFSSVLFNRTIIFHRRKVHLRICALNSLASFKYLLWKSKLELCCFHFDSLLKKTTLPSHLHDG